MGGGKRASVSQGARTQPTQPKGSEKLQTEIAKMLAGGKGQEDHVAGEGGGGGTFRPRGPLEIISGKGKEGCCK